MAEPLGWDGYLAKVAWGYSKPSSKGVLVVKCAVASAAGVAAAALLNWLLDGTLSWGSVALLGLVWFVIPLVANLRRTDAG